MKLRKDQIQKLSELVLKSLKSNKVSVFKVSEDQILSKINAVMTSELRIEDTLDDEVRKMMEQYKAQIDSGHVDYHKMFQMIKKQLIKERNIVI